MAPLSLSFCSETSPAFLPLQVLDLKAIQIDGTKACYTPSTFSESVFSVTTVTTIWTSLDISDSFWVPKINFETNPSSRQVQGHQDEKSIFPPWATRTLHRGAVAAVHRSRGLTAQLPSAQPRCSCHVAIAFLVSKSFESFESQDSSMTISSNIIASTVSRRSSASFWRRRASAYRDGSEP